jgi:hypothetical protein
MEAEVYDATRMRQALPVTRRLRTIAVVSWLGGAASILPFATEWFDLPTVASNLLLFTAVVSSFALSLVIGAWPALQHVIARVAGPPDQPARALVLVAVVGGAGVMAMLAASAVVGSL